MCALVTGVQTFALRILLAAETMAELNAINDIDLGEVERSRTLMDEADATLDGLRRVLDLWQALRRIAPLDAPTSLRTDTPDAASEMLFGRYRLTLMELLPGAGRVAVDRTHIGAGKRGQVRGETGGA